MDTPLDWDAIDLVVFDVDGTLYEARPLRGAIARRLLLEAWRSRSLHVARVLRAFRQVREALGEEEASDFLRLQYERTAQQVGAQACEVRRLVHEWMERRPLPLLRACRAPRVERVFDALRAAGKRVAVLSDYPAHDKLCALELQADLVVCASDPGIGRLKPDPRGLHALLLRSGVPAARTLVVGDRLDRDVAVARRAGTQALLRSRHRQEGVPTFHHYDEAPWQPLLAAG